MRKITVIGNTSSAKVAIKALLLSRGFDLVDLPTELSILNIGTTDLVIYISKTIDDRTLERLYESYKKVIVVSSKNSVDSPNDLFIPIENFQDNDTLEDMQLIIELVLQSIIPNISQEHIEILRLLSRGGSHEDNLRSLNIGRTTYFSLLKELRLACEVSKNWQLPRT